MRCAYIKKGGGEIGHWYYTGSQIKFLTYVVSFAVTYIILIIFIQTKATRVRGISRSASPNDRIGVTFSIIEGNC